MNDKVYMDSYMANYDWCFMICRNLRRAHLLEVGLTQILIDHVIVEGFRKMKQPLDESQGPS